MDVVSSLPDEMWLKILEYLPLHDRFEWVKFTNKRFFRLAGDISAVKDLDFHGCSYVSNDQFLKMINRSKDSVRFLSFRDCIWFSNQICTTMPRLKNLVTLDILGCFLSSEILHSLLGATCSLKRLALSTTELVMTDFCWLQSKRRLSLRVLHVELLHDPETLYSSETITVLSNFINTCCRSKPHCVLVQTLKYLPLDDFKDIMIEANPAIDRDSIQIVTRGACDETYQNRILIAVALHRNVSSLSVGCLDESRVLCLPMQMRHKNLLASCYCKEEYLPIALHELEYILSRDEDTDDPDYAEADLLNSRTPKLRHLNLGRRPTCYFGVAEAFPRICKKLPNFTNLVELNVCGLDLHANMLLLAIMDMKHLKGLSFSLHLPVQCEPDPEQDVINFTAETRDADESCRYSIFLSKLVKNFPDLEKFEMKCSMDARKYVAVSDLEPVGMLGKLRRLSLHGFISDDVDGLAKILSKCTKISSLDLGHFETDVAHDFSECFASLRHLIYLRLAHDDLEGVSKFNDLHMSSNLRRFNFFTECALSPVWIVSFLGPVFATCDLFCMCHIECENGDSAVVKNVIATYRAIFELKYGNRVILSCSDDRICQHPVCQSWQARSFSTVATCSPFDFVKTP